jgi:hypothetical protein
MAKITASANEKTIQIPRWLGLNECADGDADLKIGEAAAMQNFKITDDGSLQIRPGSRNVAGLLAAYSLNVASESTAVKTGKNVPPELFKVYPTISIGTGGVITLSGTAVTMNRNNYQSCQNGYYWKDSTGLIYQVGPLTITQSTVGEQVPGGSVYINSRTEIVAFGVDRLTCYTTVSVSNGSLVLTGGKLYLWGDKNMIGKYVLFDGAYYKITDFFFVNNNNGVWWAFEGNLVKYAGDDTYSWDFYAVTKTSNPSDTSVRGIWSGYINGTEYIVAACNAHLWSLSVDTDGVWSKTDRGFVNTASPVHFYGFDDKVYMMNGKEYKVWDGMTDTFTDVMGYVPLVAVSTVPSGGGAVLEQVNKLTGQRRVWFSPDGTAKTFQLPEKNISNLDEVKNLVSGVAYTKSADYSFNTANGTITFVSTTRTETFIGTGTQKEFTLAYSNANVIGVTVGDTATTAYVYDINTNTITFDTAPVAPASIVVTEARYPASGTNTIEVTYTMPNFRSQVLAMRYAEIYNGTTENRVFIYGDGSNEAFYSGLDYDGQPRADYFPDMNEMKVGESSTPITGLCRHYGRLLCFKEDGVYTAYYGGSISLSDGRTTAGFYLSTVNKGLGNAALGQVQLVENNARSLDGRSVYEWKAAAAYGNVTNDQRNAVNISKRIGTTLRSMDLTKAVAWFDKMNHEYYIVENGVALVNNTNNDTWYVYRNFPATCLINYKDQVYFGTTTGDIRHFSRDYLSDAGGAVIDAYWESGSMDFGAANMRKNSSMLWIGLKPETRGAVKVTVETDKQTGVTGGVYSGFFSFLDLDFENISLNVSKMPQMSRLKLKTKKFAFYKLTFSSSSNNTTATITNAEIRVRYTGYVR